MGAELKALDLGLNRAWEQRIEKKKFEWILKMLSAE